MTQNLRDYEIRKRTFHDTANRCHHRTASASPQWFLTDTLGGCGDSARNLVTWTSQRLSTTSHHTPSDIHLAQRISSSLHRDPARPTCPHSCLAGGQPGMTLNPTKG